MFIITFWVRSISYLNILEGNILKGLNHMRSFDNAINHYEVLKGDIENNQISLHNMGYFSKKVYFPWCIASKQAIGRVNNKFVLTSEQSNLMLAYKLQSDCSHDLVQSIVAVNLIEDSVTDLVDISVPMLKRPEGIRTMSFVCAVGHSNLFFITNPGTAPATFECTEVHAHKSEAYRKVILHKKQIRNTLWLGEYSNLAEKLESQIKLKEIHDASMLAEMEQSKLKWTDEEGYGELKTDSEWHYFQDDDMYAIESDYD